MFSDVVGHISFLVVFLEGVLSFFSPCVLPLIPIYMGYLAGGGEQGADGTIVYDRRRVFWHTVCFVLGVSAAFFLLGLSFTALGTFFFAHKTLLSRVGGLIIMLLGLFQLGFFDANFLQREHRVHLNLSGKRMNPLVAFVMGFTFSFAWTPCVGPALSSVLIMASGAKTVFLGNLLVGVYAIGFVIPFLLLGLFTTQILGLLKNKQNLLRYTVKAGGVLLILMGFMTFTGWMNGVTSYLNGVSAPPAQTEQADQQTSERKATPSVDFELADQFGQTHKLSDYQGKVVFINFWTTWCGYCQREMPHIQELYEEYGENTGDVIFLGLANPKSESNPYAQDEDIASITAFIEEGGYTFPTLFDTTNAVYDAYRIRSFPTTFMIDREGNIYGYVSGALTKDMMVNIIEQTMASTEDPTETP